MSNRNIKELLIGFLNITLSIIKQIVKMILRMIIILLILAIVVLALGGVLSAVVTIVVLIDNPGVSLIENFGEYYLRYFVLMLKTFGGIAIAIFIIFPVKDFFDD